MPLIWDYIQAHLNLSGSIKSSICCGVIRAPSDNVLNSLVLLLNLVSSYLEGFTKSTRLLTQTLRKTSSNHMHVFIFSHGFSIGFLKQYFRQPSTTLRWVETENQLSDALTKNMEATWLCKTLSTGRWSISFFRETIRPKKQPKRPKC